jgi:hypothetical protein
MGKIKVIKKNAAREFDGPCRAAGAGPRPQSKKRELVETVEAWVSNWRRLAEIEKLVALDKLSRLRLEDSAGP